MTAYAGGRYDHFRTEGYALQNVAPAFDQKYPEQLRPVQPQLALV
ncbi:MAG: hypothetical protein R3E41_12150 [Burkholderiaceae bacterium]